MSDSASQSVALVDLSADVLTHILEFMTPGDLGRVACCCRVLRDASSEAEERVDALWRRRADWERLRLQHVKMGYTEGVGRAREDRMQQGFDEGFREASLRAYGDAFLGGVAAALATLCVRDEQPALQARARALCDRLNAGTMKPLVLGRADELGGVVAGSPQVDGTEVQVDALGEALQCLGALGLETDRVLDRLVPLPPQSDSTDLPSDVQAGAPMSGHGAEAEEDFDDGLDW